MKAKHDADLDLIMRLMAIPGKTGEEREIASFVEQMLRQAGAKSSQIQYDDAHQRCPRGGQVGNLIVQLPGTIKGPRRMLMAHMDTVPICVGCKPVKRGGYVVSADPATGLGADNRSGVGAVLTAAMHILKHKPAHPPVTFLFAVQEEVGLSGSRYVKKSLLGKPKFAFNFDGGSPAKLTIGATGAYRMQFDLYGIASHAGVAPHHGVSAVTIAGLAIASLQRDAWLGKIEKGKKKGTSNIGVIEGGSAINVVTNHVRVRAEVRSHDPVFRKKLLNTFIAAFEKAAKQVRNVAGQTGYAKVDFQLDYEAFKLSESEPCVKIAGQAVRDAGGEPFTDISNGGLDANYMKVHGIPTVTMGAGQQHAHTVEEKLNISDYTRACRIATLLATGS